MNTPVNCNVCNTLRFVDLDKNPGWTCNHVKQPEKSRMDDSTMQAAMKGILEQFYRPPQA